MNKPKSIAFLKLRRRNEDGYLDQIYALRVITSQGVNAIPILTRRERLNYDANCRYHRCSNVFRPSTCSDNCSNVFRPTVNTTGR